jgi:hypothetical protein
MAGKTIVAYRIAVASFVSPLPPAASAFVTPA